MTRSFFLTIFFFYFWWWKVMMVGKPHEIILCVKIIAKRWSRKKPKRRNNFLHDSDNDFSLLTLHPKLSLFVFFFLRFFHVTVIAGERSRGKERKKEWNLLASKLKLNAACNKGSGLERGRYREEIEKETKKNLFREIDGERSGNVKVKGDGSFPNKSNIIQWECHKFSHSEEQKETSITIWNFGL